MLHHDNFANFYQVTYTMKQNHGWNIEEVESMLPWERQIFIAMLQRDVEAENQRIIARNAAIEAAQRKR